MDEKLLTVGELAETFGLSRETVYRRIRDGSIPYHEIGGAYRFLLSDVIAQTRRDIETKTKGRKDGRTDKTKP